MFSMFHGLYKLSESWNSMAMALVVVHDLDVEEAEGTIVQTLEVADQTV